MYLVLSRYRPVVNGVAGKWSTYSVDHQDVTVFTVYQLQPDTLYEFKVLATNDLGKGNFSGTVEAKTKGKRNGAGEVTVKSKMILQNKFYANAIRRNHPFFKFLQ